VIVVLIFIRSGDIAAAPELYLACCSGRSRWVRFHSRRRLGRGRK
jgi:hypothetical protein